MVHYFPLEPEDRLDSLRQFSREERPSEIVPRPGFVSLDGYLLGTRIGDENDRHVGTMLFELHQKAQAGFSRSTAVDDRQADFEVDHRMKLTGRINGY